MKKLVMLLGVLLMAVYAKQARGDGGLLFYGCMNNKTARVRAIKTDLPKCNKNETLVSWGQAGPTGPQGLQGDQGPVGPVGPQGIVGPIGLQGVQGLKGDTGDVGPNGPQGPIGLQGPQGDQGTVGPQGHSGNTLHVVDGDGQDLGILIGTSANSGNTFDTYVPQLGAFASFYQGRNNDGTHMTYWLNTENIYFTQLDCAGTPYGNRGRFNVLVKNVGLKRYFQYTTGSTLRLWVISSLNDGGCVNLPLPGSLQDSTEVREVTLPFTEPPTYPLQVINQ